MSVPHCQLGRRSQVAFTSLFRAHREFLTSQIWTQPWKQLTLPYLLYSLCQVDFPISDIHQPFFLRLFYCLHLLRSAFLIQHMPLLSEKSPIRATLLMYKPLRAALDRAFIVVSSIGLLRSRCRRSSMIAICLRAETVRPSTRVQPASRSHLYHFVFIGRSGHIRQRLHSLFFFCFEFGYALSFFGWLPSHHFSATCGTRTGFRRSLEQSCAWRQIQLRGHHHWQMAVA